MTNTNNHENVIETATDELRCDLCHKDLGRPVASSCELSKRSWQWLGMGLALLASARDAAPYSLAESTQTPRVKNKLRVVQAGFSATIRL